MDDLTLVLRRFVGARIEGDVWCNGSYLTEKIDPEDIDILLYLKAAFFTAATAEQKAAILRVNSNLRASHHCDSYIHIEYDDSTPLAAESEWWKAWWTRQYGFSREHELKGIAVVALMGMFS